MPSLPKEMFEKEKSLLKKKGELPFDFKYLGNIDIKLTLDKVYTITEEQWSEHGIRNEEFRVHNHTNAFEIIWDPDSLITGLAGKRNREHYNQIDFNKVKDKLQPIFLEHYGPGWYIRVLLARLKPYGRIPIHRDRGVSLMEVKRIHIPLVTNQNIDFRVGDTVKNLKAGEVWEINNARKHAVTNNSEEHRIHLIVDYLPKS